MTTATDYQEYAQECMQGARDAKRAPVRKQFLDLAKLWLEAAARLDTRVGPPLQTDKLDGHKPPRSVTS